MRKVRPKTIADFAGLEKAKIILQKFAAQPYSASLLFSGPTGIGKTSMALALVSDVEAEMHPPVPTPTRGDIDRVWTECQGFPAAELKKHLILVHEIDGVVKAASTALIAKLDVRGGAPDIIWAFTCPTIERLDRRFRSFCMETKFPSYGIAKGAAELLKRVWEAEGGPAGAIPPNFARILKESNNYIRAALMTLETLLITAEAH